MKIQHSCPHIDRIQEILLNYVNSLQPEDLCEIIQKLERIRSINTALREACDEPYNFAKVMKNLKIKLPDKKDIIDETIKAYY